MQYNPFDKIDDREYSREEKIERLKAAIAYRKTYKVAKNNKGKVLLNNGEKGMWYDADMPIPEGWELGRIKRGAKHEQ